MGFRWDDFLLMSQARVAGSLRERSPSFALGALLVLHVAVFIPCILDSFILYFISLSIISLICFIHYSLSPLSSDLKRKTRERAPPKRSQGLKRRMGGQKKRSQGQNKRMGGDEKKGVRDKKKGFQRVRDKKKGLRDKKK